MIEQKDLLYSFEPTKRSRRLVGSDHPTLIKLLDRLELPEVLRPILLEDLQEFVKHVILNINWYHEQIALESDRKKLWFWATVVLALVIPVGVALIEQIVSKGTSFALIAAMVSGAGAIHRMLSQFLEHRNIGVVFSEAAAQLKDILYSFEDKWAGKILSLYDLNLFSTELLEDLDSSIRRAKRVVSDEKLKFYGASAPPAIGLNVKAPQVQTVGDDMFALDSGASATSRFRFDFQFSEEQKEVVRTAHRRIWSHISNCDVLSSEEKSKLVLAYSKPIHHNLISGSNLGEAHIGGITVGLNLDHLMSLGTRELDQTLIHEMMHCAGFTHRDKLPTDVPHDNGDYYGSAPLKAELCIAGMQSDVAETSTPLELSCLSGDGAFCVAEDRGRKI